MPANLSPEYHRAEQRFRSARTPDERVSALEEMLRVIPKHKGTDHMQADLKSRLAKLRRECGKKAGKGGFSYVIPREGAGQIGLAGPPNSGKSSLVRALTHAAPAVGDYPFTTREPVPGMMPFEDIAFQLIDMPPLSEQHVEPWVFDLIRYADLIWLVLDGACALEGYDESVRLLDAKNIGLHPASVPPRYDRAAVQKKAMIVATGLDRPGVAGEVAALEELLERRWRIVPVSAVDGRGLDELRALTFEAFDIIRIYTKQPGKPPDRNKPFTLPRGSNVADLASRIHNELAGSMTFARVWGHSAFEGQAVMKEHVLGEGDVVEIHE
ncbi:MAG: GTPase [Acidobacteriota bacterium]